MKLVAAGMERSESYQRQRPFRERGRDGGLPGRGGWGVLGRWKTETADICSCKKVSLKRRREMGNRPRGKWSEVLFLFPKNICFVFLEGKRNAFLNASGKVPHKGKCWRCTREKTWVKASGGGWRDQGQPTDALWKREWMDEINI